MLVKNYKSCLGVGLEELDTCHSQIITSDVHT